MGKPKTSRVSINARISPEMYSYLLVAAHARKISMSDVVRDIVNAHIAEETLVKRINALCTDGVLVVDNFQPGVLRFELIPNASINAAR